MGFITSTVLFVGLSATAPNVQRINFSLALAIACAFVRQKVSSEYSLTSSDILQATEHYTLKGRFQKIVDGNNQWFLDGAHNELSVPKVAQWFT